MLVSWYLPTIEFSLWPCAILLIVFIPVSIWHERNWRRTLAAYAALRREHGAAEGPWPPSGLTQLMGVQPGLVLIASALLGLGVIVAATVALMWPRTPPGFDLPINPLDLPFLWSMVVAGTAAVVAGVAIAVDIWRNPWSWVAWLVRRAMYARPEVRARLFAQALAADPELRAQAAGAAGVSAAEESPEPQAPGEPSAPEPPASS